MKIYTQNRFLVSLVIFSVTLFLLVQNTWARGGGGGSGGGGSSSGGGFGGGGDSSGGVDGITPLIFVFIIFCFTLVVYFTKRQQTKKIKKQFQMAAKADQLWQEADLEQKVRKVFVQFQNDWSNFNIESMKDYLVDDFYKKMVLEMNVLKNQNRQNIITEVVIKQLATIEVVDQLDNSQDHFTVMIFAGAHDVLLDTLNNAELFVDDDDFTELWNFAREDNNWKLSSIKQVTENKLLLEENIIDFAKSNSFFYDPDFGWLMMPNRGAIFGKSNFMSSDINNHVIGHYRDKIVEFYTFIPNINNNLSANYVVAQVILPIKYNDILLRKRRSIFNLNPSGLNRIKTESNDFDKKFCLWADPKDQVNSFELLTPNFMEKIYNLPFELNIEVVDSFLYLYAKSRTGVDYNKMLEILSWSFDEMKM